MSSDKPNPMLVFAAVKQAHLYAMSAVGADEKQDYPTALANYRQVISILRAEVSHASLEDQPAFQDRVCDVMFLLKGFIKFKKKKKDSRLFSQDGTH